jgi:hypothetical protein
MPPAQLGIGYLTMSLLEPTASEPCTHKENNQGTLCPHQGDQFPAHTKFLLSSLTVLAVSLQKHRPRYMAMKSLLPAITQCPQFL